MARTLRGRPDPLGATVSARGVDFCLYSEHAERVELLLFDRPGDARPAQVVALDPAANRSNHYWHAVANTEGYRRDLAAAPGDGTAHALKGVVVDPSAYDGEGDAPIVRPYVSSAIYELHVRGFTRHPGARVRTGRAGTYAGLAEKIPWLQELGVRTVELMPVNFVTAHDGFTLRARLVRNLCTVLLVAQGRPMWLMGDEAGRTQRGDNNAHALDDETSWLDWDAARGHEDLRRFVAGLLAFRQGSRLFRTTGFWGDPGDGVITRHGVRLGAPDWGEDSHSPAFEVASDDGREHVHVMLNAWWETLDFELPPLPPGRAWGRLVDTGRAPPDDLASPPAPIGAATSSLRLLPRSAAVLVEGLRGPGRARVPRRRPWHGATTSSSSEAERGAGRWRATWRRRGRASSCWSAAASCPGRRRTGTWRRSSSATGT